ncbi:hypothetical protein GCM10020218_058670 [Dactylosporangium vinaceum]
MQPVQIACGVVHATWRAALEPWHARLIHDHEMAYLNIATTIHVTSHCDLDAIAWDAIGAVLQDPDRDALPGRTAGALLGDNWSAFTADLADLIDDARAKPPLAMAAWAHLMCGDWWGMPGFDEQVDAVVRSGRVTRFPGTGEALARLLRDDPLAVPLQVWQEIVPEGNGLRWSDHQSGSRNRIRLQERGESRSVVYPWVSHGRRRDGAAGRVRRGRLRSTGPPGRGQVVECGDAFGGHPAVAKSAPLLS